MAKRASTKYTFLMLCMALALWLCTCKGSQTESPPATNPQGPKQGSGRVIRGSAFLYETFKLRSAYRGAYYPSFQGAYIGIGCIREVPTRD